MDNFLERLTLEGAGGQTDDTRSTFRPPLKTLGYNCSNSLLGRSVGILRHGKNSIIFTLFWLPEVE